MTLKKKHFEFDAEIKAIGDDGEFEGYGSVFGVVEPCKKRDGRLYLDIE